MNLGLGAGEHTLDLAKELGVRGVPIQASDLVDKGVDAVLEPLAQRGLAVCQIGAFGFNPLSSDRKRQDEQAAALARTIPLAGKTGCPYVVICGGNHHPSGFGADDPRNHTAEALDRVALALEPMLTLAESHGVKISIEPYLKTAISTPASFLSLKERVGSDALRVNIDVTSFYDYHDLLDPVEKVHQVCTVLAGHYGLGHAKEIALAEGFHIHAGLVPLGAGPTDWSQVLSLMLPHMPDDSWLVLEHVVGPEEARSSVPFLRESAKKAGVLLA